MKPITTAVCTLLFSMFLMFICLALAHSYPGARHYSCGTPAAVTETAVEYFVPFGVLAAYFGWQSARSVPVASLIAGSAAFLLLLTWLGSLAFVVFHHQT